MNPGSKIVQPPRITRALLSILLPSGFVGEAIRGDLDEEFRCAAERDSVTAARRWYRRQAFGLVSRFVVTGRLARLFRRHDPSPSNRRPGTRSSSYGQRLRLFDSAERLVLDIAHGLRSQRRTPGLSLVIVMTLAVGIAANVAMFGIVDAVLLQALPYPDSNRLVLARTTVEGQLAWDASSEDYYDYRDQVEAFASLGAYRTRLEDVTLSGVDQPMVLTATMVSVDLFQTLGVVPEMGRLFVEEDAELVDPGDITVARAVLLSHRIWQRVFGGDPGVVGRTIALDEWPSIVVGVMPAEFFFLHEVDAWWPLQPGGRYTASRSNHVWTLVGRLADGVTLQEAQSQVDVVSARLQQAYPSSNRGKGLEVSPLHASLVENYDEMLLTLTAAMALVLLVACMNVAGLLLARGAGRTRELSVMAAMGASRGRLARQMISESLLMAAAAGLLGTVLAMLLQQIALGILPLDHVGITRLGLSGTMVSVALLLTLFTTLASGMTPAWFGSRANPAVGLAGGPRSTEAGGAAGVRSGLVVLQVALSLILLIGSGLLVKSFVRLTQVEPGFRPEGLLTARVSLPFPSYGSPYLRGRFVAELLEGVREIPGVQAAGAAHLLPMVDIDNQHLLAFDPENPPVGLGDRWVTEHRQVFPGFFEAMRIPLLAGRDFTVEDLLNREPALIINRTMARGLFGDENPIGRSVVIDLGFGRTVQAAVVGIVEDIRMLALDRDPERQMYSLAGLFSVSGTWGIAVRTDGDPVGFTDPIRQVLHAIDPDLPLAHVTTMKEAFDRAVATPRVLTTSLTLFAAFSLGLSLLGLYAMLAFYVARRVRDIGIRMAVGAGTKRIISLVLRRGLMLAAMGLVLGLGGAVLLTRVLQGQLYQVEPTDPTTFVLVSLVLVAVAVVACIVPAWRAASVDPVQALQTE